MKIKLPPKRLSRRSWGCLVPYMLNSRAKPVRDSHGRLLGMATYLPGNTVALAAAWDIRIIR